MSHIKRALLLALAALTVGFATPAVSSAHYTQSAQDAQSAAVSHVAGTYCITTWPYPLSSGIYYSCQSIDYASTILYTDHTYRTDVWFTQAEGTLQPSGAVGWFFIRCHAYTYYTHSVRRTDLQEWQGCP